MPYCPSKTTAGRFAASLTIVARNTTIFASRNPSLERVSEDEAEKATKNRDIGADDVHGEEKKEDKPGNDGKKGDDKKAVIQSVEEHPIDTYSLLEPTNPDVPTITLTECWRVITNPKKTFERWVIPWAAPANTVLSGHAQWLPASKSWRVSSTVFRALPDHPRDLAPTPPIALRRRGPPPMEDEFADIDLDNVPYKDDDIFVPLRRTSGPKSRSGWPKYSLSASLSAALPSSRSPSRPSTPMSSSTTSLSSLPMTPPNTPTKSSKTLDHLGMGASRMGNHIREAYRQCLPKHLNMPDELSRYDHDEAVGELHAMAVAAYNPVN